MIEIYIFLVLLFFSISGSFAQENNETCGIDYSTVPVVYEGFASLTDYPWMGYLFYPMQNNRLLTVVVLVTKQVVIGSAIEIDKLPKTDFRRRARVVLGRSCLEPAFRVREYTFHPEYDTQTYSALVLIQLDLDNVREELWPICPPPVYFLDPKFYAITLSDDCSKPQLRLHEMQFVPFDECKSYYRRSGLDLESIWPKFTTCARASSGGECVWNSGAALVVKHVGRWRMLGFGIYGPGCEAPSRFVDYGMYSEWVTTNLLRIGKPTLSRINDGEVILRRSLYSVQRYGPCDPEEMQIEIWSDNTYVEFETKDLQDETKHYRRVRYFVQLYANVEYSCVVFRAKYSHIQDEQPILRVRRWCAGSAGFCYEFGIVEIGFYIEIRFRARFQYTMRAYGRVPKVMDPRKVYLFVNKHIQNTTSYMDLPGVQALLDDRKDTSDLIWWRRCHRFDPKEYTDRINDGSHNRWLYREYW